VASLVVIVWMSLTSAVLYGSGPEWWVRPWAHAAVQAACLLAACVQAGFLETGRDSVTRRPLQALALLAFAVNVALSHPGAVELLRSL